MFVYADLSFYLVFDGATSLISDRNLELRLEKKWVSVLKLSTIWNMTKQSLKLDRRNSYIH